MPPRMSTQISTLPGLCRSAKELLSLRVLSNFRCCPPFTCPCHGMYMGCVREHSRILFCCHVCCTEAHHWHCQLAPGESAAPAVLLLWHRHLRCRSPKSQSPPARNQASCALRLGVPSAEHLPHHPRLMFQMTFCAMSILTHCTFGNGQC